MGFEHIESLGSQMGPGRMSLDYQEIRREVKVGLSNLDEMEGVLKNQEKKTFCKTRCSETAPGVVSKKHG
jgi:hypothetical protein